MTWYIVSGCSTLFVRGRERGTTYLRGSDAAFVDDELVRGETPDFFLVGGVAEFVESLVTFGSKAYDDQARGVVGIGGIVGSGLTYDFDKLVLGGASGGNTGGVVRATDEGVRRRHDSGKG